MSIIDIWSSVPLHGMSIDKARLFGMPHVGCHYANLSVNSHKLDRGARCAVCGQIARHAHHEPQKGMGGTRGFLLHEFALRPALLALCPQCHHDRHFSDLSFTWLWEDDESEAEWASGKLLRDGFGPGSEELFSLGYWVVLRNHKPIGRIKGQR